MGRFRKFVDAVVRSGATPAKGSGKHTHLNNGHGLINVGSDGGTMYETGWNAAWNSYLIDGAPTASLNDPGNWIDIMRACPRSTWEGNSENRPINCVNWWDAYAFCIWDGGFLPTQAEWEYAAAGGSQQREYPWGAVAPGTDNHYAVYGCYYPAGMTSLCAPSSMDWTATPIAPVGSATLGTGLWGQLDLAGNVAEWVLDTSSQYTGCVDCVDLSSDATTPREVRGGGFRSPISDILPSYDFSGTPTNRDDDQGFRCARVP